MIRWGCTLITSELDDDEKAPRPERTVATATVVAARPRTWTMMDVLDTDADLACFMTWATTSTGSRKRI